MSKTIEISVYDLQELRNENKMLHEEQWRLHRLWSKDTKHIAELEKENKKLKEKISELEDVSEDYDLLSKDFIALWEENKKLKKERDLYKARNEELNENCFWLAKENENLKSDLAFERTMLDNVKAEYKSLQNVNKKLNEKIERWEKCFKKWWFNPQDVECLMEEDTLQEFRDIGEI